MKTIDLRQDAEYTLKINKDRDLDATLTAQFYTGSTGNYTLVDFNFVDYTGATLQVKKTYSSSDVILEFNTIDGSIVLNTTSFNLNKSASDLSNLKEGDYIYSMYLSNATQTKRAFLAGQFIITNTING